MPSKKKKARGKARGAAKSRKAKEEREAIEVADEEALLEKAINLAAAERKKLEATAKNDEENKVERCDHGFSPLPRGHVCELFIRSFVREYRYSASNKNSTIGRLSDASQATQKYTAVWSNPDMLKHVMSHFLAEGTNEILEERDDIARHSGVLAIYFEQVRDQLTGNNTSAFKKTSNAAVLSSDICDGHTLVSFFRKRIPCKCLDKKYKEVKSIVKMGQCMNSECPLPHQRIERSKLMVCEQCLTMCYCSVECQKAAWPRHKEDCVRVSDICK